MKGFFWKTETHVFETHIEDGHVILSAKSRISETPACKFLLSKKDAEGLGDILYDSNYEIKENLGAVVGLEEVNHG